MSLKDRVMDEFDKEYPEDEEIGDLNTDQYGSLAKESWGIWWLVFGATAVIGSPFMFGISMFLFFLLLPFTLMWIISGTYDWSRWVMRESIEQHMDEREEEFDKGIEEPDYKVMEP